MLSNSIKKLVQYGIQTGLTPETNMKILTAIFPALSWKMCSETFWTKHAAAAS